MNTDKFIKACKQLIADYVLRNFDLISTDEVQVVWQTKVLQNNKALLVVPGASPEIFKLYFEITYNGDKEEYYLDVYKKQENKKIRHKVS